MSGLFTIPVSGLKEGRHNYYFEINNEFFEQFEESEVKEGKLQVKVDADKRTTHIDLSIGIDGVISISCDRCLGIFSLPVSSRNRLLVKFGRIHDESDPDILTIPADEHDLDLGQHFYEYIFLSIPIQKVHPDDNNGNSTCDPEMLEKLKEHFLSEENNNDPRWEELKRFMNNN
jgi:uncharacterized protein